MPNESTERIKVSVEERLLAIQADAIGLGSVDEGNLAWFITYLLSNDRPRRGPPT